MNDSVSRVRFQEGGLVLINFEFHLGNVSKEALGKFNLRFLFPDFES
jgi:hypothetical protein